MKRPSSGMYPPIPEPSDITALLNAGGFESRDEFAQWADGGEVNVTAKKVDTHFGHATVVTFSAYQPRYNRTLEYHEALVIHGPPRNVPPQEYQGGFGQRIENFAAKRLTLYGIDVE